MTNSFFCWSACIHKCSFLNCSTCRGNSGEEEENYTPLQGSRILWSLDWLTPRWLQIQGDHRSPDRACSSMAIPASFCTVLLSPLWLHFQDECKTSFNLIDMFQFYTIIWILDFSASNPFDFESKLKILLSSWLFLIHGSHINSKKKIVIVIP